MSSQRIEADTELHLHQIRNDRTKSIVEQLLEIQEHMYEDEKSFDWVRKLQCLTLSNTSRKWRPLPNGQWICESGTVLRRIQVAGCNRESPFLAVSYRWEDPRNQDSFTRYKVESRNGLGPIPSRVGDQTWDRVIAFMKYYKMCGIWIDKESIDQENSREKAIAVQSMDLVYSNSACSVGLLSTPIERREDINLLKCFLREEFISRPYPRGSNPPSLEQPMAACIKVLLLLDRIVSDPWWSRAWIYQEEYRSSMNMTLLIPCSLTLDRDEKREFGGITGELQVNSLALREQATLFCLAYFEASAGYQWQEGLPTCKRVFNKAKKFTTLCEYTNIFGDGERMKAMSPAIFEDIGCREISNPEDVLPIAANCCGYTTRLDTEMLKRKRCSLSICILALYLLNGEIFRNDENGRSLLSKTIFDFLKRQSLDNFDPPVQSKGLTFMKSCRFVDVQLSRDGIQTPGWLWKLNKRINTRELTGGFPLHPNLSNGNDIKNKLSQSQRAILRQLASILRYKHKTLAQELEIFLTRDAANRNKDLPSTRYKYIMAKEVIRAIECGRILHLGILLNGYHNKRPYRAIFVGGTSNDDIPRGSHVFTSWDLGRPAEDTRAQRDIEKYVSIKVSMDGISGGRMKRLRTERWINGLCFFGRCPRMTVVFPWPDVLTE